MEAATAQVEVAAEAVFVTPKHDLLLTVRKARYEKRDIMDRVIQAADSGRHIQFVDGTYSTTDPEEIEYIRSHAMFNIPRGIWEMGNAPDEPKPTVAEQMKAISGFSVERDADGLRELIEDEEDEHNRHPILASAREALAQVEAAGLETTAAEAAARHAEQEAEQRIAEAEARAAEAEAKLAEAQSASDTAPKAEADGAGQPPEGGAETPGEPGGDSPPAE